MSLPFKKLSTRLLAIYILCAVLVTGITMVIAHSREEQRGIDMQYKQVEQSGLKLSQRVGQLIAIRINTLERLAGSSIDQASFNSQPIKQWQATLAHQQALLTLFDDILVFDAEGHYIADLPNLSYRNEKSVDIADRPYFQKLKTTHQPVISQPLVSKLRKMHGITICVPILDKDMHFLGAITGFIVLTQDNPFSQLIRLSSSDDDYAFIAYTDTSDKALKYLAHPALDRIGQPLNQSLKQAWNTQYSKLNHQPIEQLEPRMGDSLIHFSAVPGTEWSVGVVSSLGPVREQVDNQILANVLSALVLLTLSLPGLIWMIKRQLRPITELSEVIKAQLANQPTVCNLEYFPSEELAQVAQLLNQLHTARVDLIDNIRARKKELNSILEVAHDAVIVIDDKGEVLKWNASCEQLFGYSENEMLRRGISCIMPEHLRGAHEMGIERYKRTGISKLVGQTVEVTALRRDGQTFPLELSLSDYKYSGQHRFVAICRDITQRKLADAALIESEQKLRTIADNAPYVVAYVTADQIITFCNQTCAQLFNKTVDELQGQTVQQAIGPLMYEQIKDYLEQAINGETVRYERHIIQGGIPKDISAVYVPHHSTQGDVVGIFVFLADVTDRKDTERRLSQMAYYDDLTGLANRALFNDRLEQAINRARIKKRLVGLLLIDLDKLKSVNENLGRHYGDALMRAFSARLKHSVHTTDTVARQGSDEFIIILEGLKSQTDFEQIVEKFSRLNGISMSLFGREQQVTFCMGATLSTSTDTNIGTLIKRLDQAIHTAKLNGPGTTHIILSDGITSVNIANS